MKKLTFLLVSIAFFSCSKEEDFCEPKYESIQGLWMYKTFIEWRDSSGIILKDTSHAEGEELLEYIDFRRNGYAYLRSTDFNGYPDFDTIKYTQQGKSFVFFMNQDVGYAFFPSVISKTDLILHTGGKNTDPYSETWKIYKRKK
jgi:hypothetical protein